MLPRFQMKKTQELCKISSQKGIAAAEQCSHWAALGAEGDGSAPWCQ